MKNGKLNGKVAVVTGASKGIGAAIAKEFAAEGASVVVNYASAKQDADRVVDEISKANGKAMAIQGNVAKKEDVVGAVNQGWSVGKRLLQHERSGMSALVGGGPRDRAVDRHDRPEPQHADDR